MKKIIFVFIILLLVAPVIAGENDTERQNKEFFILAYTSACNDNCRDDLNFCKKKCKHHNNELLLKMCFEDCMDDYDRCIRRCD